MAADTRGFVDLASGDGTLTNLADLISSDDIYSIHTDELGQTTVTYYNRLGLVTKTVDALGVVTTYERNEHGQVLEESVDQDGDGPLAALVTTYVYDTRGNLVEQTLRDGSVKQWTYDLTTNEIATYIDQLGNTWTFTYDAVGNRLTETDPLGNVTSYTYNAKGLVTSVSIDPDGQGPLVR